jgi:hypothetical protein
MVVDQPRDMRWMPGCAFRSLFLTTIMVRRWFYSNKGRESYGARNGRKVFTTNTCGRNRKQSLQTFMDPIVMITVLIN